MVVAGFAHNLSIDRLGIATVVYKAFADDDMDLES